MKRGVIRKKFSIFSWAMYDFANTIFAMNVITLYFALWVTVDKKADDIFYSVALSGSMFFSALTSPVLGAISDRIGKKMPFLIAFTILCCLFTAFIGITDHLILGLIFFALANYFFQTADIFYNALLPHVSGYEKVGRVSGYGTGLGYLGTIVGLLLVSPIALKFGRSAAFIPTSLLFLFFALPCFLFVKDPKTLRQKSANLKMSHVVLMAFLKVKNTIVHVRRYPGLLHFFIAIFLSFNAINTVYIFMSVYTKKVVGFSDTKIIWFYIVSSLFAIVGAVLAGVITDRFGAKRTLTAVLMIWVFSMMSAIFTVNKEVFWIIGPIIGISLGSTWTSARTLAVDLSPPEMIGEVFGFYGLMGKTASILGPLVWGLSTSLFDFLGIEKYRISLAVLILFLILGLMVLQKVPSED